LRHKHGVEQTEIDALATLRPELLREIVEEACEPYYDATLARRVADAKSEWEDAAQEELDEKLDEEILEDIRERAQQALDELREKLEEAGEIEIEISLPPPPIPEAEPAEDGPDPLVSSDMPLVEAIDILRARKRYTNGKDEA
jgi:hypothetical protein